MSGHKLRGRYQIVQQLGSGGGFGATYIACDTDRPGNPKCLVKQLKPRTNDPNTLQIAQRFFKQEAEIQEELGNNDQIPRLLAYFEENQEFYLVQEFIEGHDLRQELPPLADRLSEAETIKLVTEILEVLAFVHRQGVIHRDIKPANIMRRFDGKIVLIDFGAVKKVRGLEVNQQGQTVTVAIGTLGYMPSEQAAGEPQFSSDVYAVGVIGIQALTGIYPDPSQGSKLPRDPQTGEIIWRDQAHVSPELADILDRMVRYHFSGRYQSAESALEALRQISDKNIAFKQKISSFASPWKWLFPLGIVAVLVSVVVGIWPGIWPGIWSGKKQEKFLPYENSEYQIKIKYPETWQLQIKDINAGGVTELATIISPKQNDTDRFQEKINIEIEEFSGTLAESKELFIDEIKNTLPDAQIINMSSTTLAFKQANQIIYTGKNGDIELKNLQIWTLKGDKAYIITYTAAIDDYDEFINTANEMIHSFEID
ncbi:MAG: protein kinase [Pelatocladus maniniholoensis HA4357-MV3]|jgi:serine/threonine protein kinase|uniref:non-specific serine/threonine protein kinase n=1 Tax=Pelatocladus maniniholoensis HA4357-MV3 TaxID=1117104 RepID=A0A9E3LTN7_9NOST|nr:protein kinase [Pelatocladus maniniholoensis HA4357-MV3]BAZ69160.1 serine/threonine protein kinase [Fischerella sp. NIES-4106]